MRSLPDSQRGSQAVRSDRVQLERGPGGVQAEQNIRSDVIPAGGRPVDSLLDVFHPETRARSGNFRPLPTGPVDGYRAFASTSGRSSFASPRAPVGVRWSPSESNQGLLRLYRFQSATTRLFRHLRPALRMRAFDCL